MVWVKLHENEASRATEHKKFYKATTGKWTDILRIQEKEAPKQRISLVAYRLADEYLHEIQTHEDQSYFYYRAKCFHSFKVREGPHN